MQPVELQAHFETAHSSEASLSAAKQSEGRIGDLKDEVSELQETLREEQQYSTELKKEVQKLSDAVTSKLSGEAGNNGADAAAAAEDEEKRMYREQARALEEGKNIRKGEFYLMTSQVRNGQFLPAAEPLVYN